MASETRSALKRVSIGWGDKGSELVKQPIRLRPTQTPKTIADLMADHCSMPGVSNGGPLVV